VVVQGDERRRDAALTQHRMARCLLSRATDGRPLGMCRARIVRAPPFERCVNQALRPTPPLRRRRCPCL
jgi:hypothetical protein